MSDVHMSCILRISGSLFLDLCFLLSSRSLLASLCALPSCLLGADPFLYHPALLGPCKIAVNLACGDFLSSLFSLLSFLCSLPSSLLGPDPFLYHPALLGPCKNAVNLACGDVLSSVSEILHFAEVNFVIFQISLHLSAEIADLQNVDYLSMFFRSLFG